MADTEQEAQWRKAFEKIGPDTLRLKLATTDVTLPTEYIRCAEAWILEKDAEKTALESERYHKLSRWAITAGIAGILAAIAAWVAAWPIMKEWLR
jgi:hypothetical protein